MSTNEKIGTDRAILPDMPSLTPHLVCQGAAAAIDYYVKAFGAVEVARLPGADGRLLHAMVRIGDSMLMLVDEFPEQGCVAPQQQAASSTTLHLFVEDVDAAVARAVEAGARLTMPVADMFWGDRYGRLQDPFGHHWSIATHLRDVSSEEMLAAVGTACPQT